jgi:spore germination cell wall hydrolase CwlJ-like protein
MRVNELFTDEMIDEDIRKTLGAAMLGGALLATPVGHSVVKDQPAATSYSRDVAVLTATIWGEARGHGAEGMNAVGHVIKNRVDAHKKMFGIGLPGVIKKDKQFSCWNSGDPNRAAIKDMANIWAMVRDRRAPDGRDFDEWFAEFKTSGSYRDFVAWQKANKIAREILSDKSPDPTNGAVYYHTTAVKPYWASEMVPVSKVANHIFYSLPSKNS